MADYELLEMVLYAALLRADTKPLAKRPLDLSASAIILAHNHPGGDPTPSKGDIAITRQIAAAAASLWITVHDHIVIAGAKHYSFKSNGLI